MQAAVGSLDDLQTILQRVADTGDEWARELIPKVAARVARELATLCGGPNSVQTRRICQELDRRLERIGHTSDRQGAMAEAAAGLRALVAVRAVIAAA